MDSNDSPKPALACLRAAASAKAGDPDKDWSKYYEIRMF